MLPVLYQNPEFTLYAYPLFMGFGWGVGYQFYLAGLGDSVSALKRLLIFWGLFLASWLGAKSLFIFSVPESFPQGLLAQVSFWTGGGFVFYGGFLGALVFLVFYASFVERISSRTVWSILLGLAFGHAVGRIGCLLAGCCFGAPTELPWGIHLHGVDRHPTQVLEAFALVGLGTYLLRAKSSKDQLILHYMVAYGAIRFFIELLRGDGIRGQWGVMTPSQWISLILISVGLLGAKLLKRRRSRSL